MKNQNDPLKQFDEIVESYRRSLLGSMGLRKSDVEKPIVGIMHGFNQMSPGNFNNKNLVEAAKIAVASEGGTPVEIPIPGVCGSMSGGAESFRYNFPYRDSAAGLAEVMLSINRLDACVFIPTCDNVVPAYLNAAARVNIPSVFLTGGFMKAGCYKGKTMTAFDVPKVYAARDTSSGVSDEEELERIIYAACPTTGGCPEIGTANTMASVAEALGVSLPGNATTATVESKLIMMAKEAGERVMDLWRKNIRFRDIVNNDALEDTAKVVLAIGGSPNGLLHLLALSQEVGGSLKLQDWDEYGKEVPLICRIKPNHPSNTMVDFAAAGGIYRVLYELKSVLKSDRMTVLGITMKEAIERETPRVLAAESNGVIESLDNPVETDGGINVLYGNLSPEGAVVKSSAVPDSMKKFSGPAKVYNSEVEAAEGLFSGKVKEGEVIVVRYEGPRGAPGAREVMLLMHAIVGMGLSEKIGVITDGRFSGTNLGLAVGHVAPEAMAGGLIGLVEDGDMINIDLHGRLVEVDLSYEEIEKRRSVWTKPEPKNVHNGLLMEWYEKGGSLSTGGILGR